MEAAGAAAAQKVRAAGNASSSTAAQGRLGCAVPSPLTAQQVTVTLHAMGTAVPGLLIPWHPLELAVFPCAILGYQSPLPGWMSHIFMGRLILT